MSNYMITPLHRSQASEIYDNLKELDKIEVDIAYDSKEAFLDDLSVCDWAKCVVVEERPVMMFGVAPSEFPNVGVPWMLHSEIEPIKKDFIKKCRYFVDQMQNNYEQLVNFVHNDNKVAQRWLRFCGFYLGKDPIEIKGHLLIPFHRRKDV